MPQQVERMLPLRNGLFNVHLVEGGVGPNLVFLHGDGGFTGWTPFLNQLSGPTRQRSWGAGRRPFP